MLVMLLPVLRPVGSEGESAAGAGVCATIS